MRALVTGGTGFIGKHVVRELMKHGEITSIISISRNNPETSLHFRNPHSNRHVLIQDAVNLENEREVAETLGGYQPDFIFHLAANPIVKEDESNLCGITRTNVLGTHHLLAHCKQGTRFCYASSATVYGGGLLPKSEDHPTNPSSAYAATKLAGENFVSIYDKQGKISSVSFRLVATVGPGATHGVVPAIIGKLKSHSTYLELLGNEPGSIKPFVYVKDAAKFIVETTLNPCYRGVVNVGVANSISVAVIAGLIQDTMRIRKRIRWLGQDSIWAGDDQFLRINSDRANIWRFAPEFACSSLAIIQAAKDLI